MRCYPNCPNAVAHIRGGADAACLSGQIRFYQERESVLVVADLSGLPRDSKTGFFALHIHEGGSCEGNAEDPFAGAGGHYNPGNLPHPRHAGDLPPLFGNHGYAYLSVFTNRFRVSEIIGRVVVIHGKPDDFTSQPAGAAGAKIACGIICC